MGFYLVTFLVFLGVATKTAALLACELIFGELYLQFSFFCAFQTALKISFLPG